MAQPNITYEQFQNALNNSGIANQFSDYDLSVAQNNPEFGMSILNLKQQYANASTAEQKALINEQANQLRSSYGGYTGDYDGSQYVSDGKIPNQVDNVLDKIYNYGSFNYSGGAAPTYTETNIAPTYTNNYGDTANDLLNQYLNRGEFEYDKNTDPSYQAYAKQYRREGDRATANALGQAAMASGGLPSSYAMTAATQAGDYYATQLADMIPTLYQQAYERWLNSGDQVLNQLNAVNNQEQLDYNKYLDQLSQYNTDRNFSWNQYLSALDQYNTDRNFAYQDYLNQYDILQNTLSSLQGQQSYDDSMKQQQWENDYNLANLLGYTTPEAKKTLGVAAGTLTADNAYNTRYLDIMENQDKFDNAMTLFNTLGYTTPEIAQALGLDAGTLTSSEYWKQWNASQETGTSSGSSSGGSSGGRSSSGSSKSSSSSSSSDSSTKQTIEGATKDARKTTVSGGNYTEGRLAGQVAKDYNNYLSQIATGSAMGMTVNGSQYIESRIKALGLTGEAAQLYRDYFNAM